MSLREMQIDRREFIRNGAMAGLATSHPGLFATGNGQKKPNILLIMSDEHNPKVSGCYGDKIVQTPNIDALAAQGVTFHSHYCNSPLCTPSRSSFTAGKYSSRVDVWGLTSELPSDDMPSLPRAMNAAGYQSYLCGKMHYEESRRYGFIQTGGDYNHYPKNGRGKRQTPDQIRAHNPVDGRFKAFHVGDRSSTMTHDIGVTNGAVDFLSKRTGSTPFFLLVGFLAPHFPLVVPEPFYAQYKDKIPMANIPPGFLDTLATNQKLERTFFQETDVPDPTVKFGRELYYGLTTWMDNNVGKVLAALRANPEIADNTVIIYTTDHGENMSEHGLWWKGCMYEQAARIPMIITWPQRWKGGQQRNLTSAHLDLVKTVIDIGGGHTPDDWNGDSLVPWLDDANYKWKDFACSEYYAQFIAHGFVMVRTGRWKYVYHGSPGPGMPVERQLFDLQTDPEEFHNLAGDAKNEPLMRKLHARMVKEVGGDPEITEQRARAQLAKGYAGKENVPDSE